MNYFSARKYPLPKKLFCKDSTRPHYTSPFFWAPLRPPINSFSDRTHIFIKHTHIYIIYVINLSKILFLQALKHIINQTLTGHRNHIHYAKKYVCERPFSTLRTNFLNTSSIYYTSRKQKIMFLYTRCNSLQHIY